MTIFQVDLDYMQARLNANDRSGFYLYYYGLTGSKEALTQAQVSSYSGFYGNNAYIDNEIVKASLSAIGKRDLYPATTDDFSLEIAQKTLDAIKDSVDSGLTGVLSDTEIFNIARDDWTDRDLHSLFPGNPLEFASSWPVDPTKIPAYVADLVGTPFAAAIYSGVENGVPAFNGIAPNFFYLSPPVGSQIETSSDGTVSWLKNSDGNVVYGSVETHPAPAGVTFNETFSGNQITISQSAAGSNGTTSFSTTFGYNETPYGIVVDSQNSTLTGPFGILNFNHTTNGYPELTMNGAPIEPAGTALAGIAMNEGELKISLTDLEDSQPWRERAITYDPNGHQIGSLYQYNDAQTWGQDHSFNPNHLAGFDSNAVQAITGETERGVFHGLAATEGTPSALSFEPELGPVYDFTGGTFNVDFDPQAETTVFSLEDLSGGSFDTADLSFTAPPDDLTGFDFYDWQLPVDVVDFWDFGDSFEPVILDLGTDGVEIRPRQDSTVYFDVDQDHFSEQTAWAGPNDGFLVIDLAANGAPGPDGTINQAKEISFALYTNQPGATDAEALRAFDTNANGQLDSGDTRFSEFRIWQDANQSGGVDAGELKTLTALGITSISLATGGLPFLLQDGSEIHGSGTYVANGVTHTYEDAALAYDATGFTRQVTPNGFEYISEDGTRSSHAVPMMSRGTGTLPAGREAVL